MKQDKGISSVRFLPALCKGIHSRLTLEYSQVLCILQSLWGTGANVLCQTFLSKYPQITFWGYILFPARWSSFVALCGGCTQNTLWLGLYLPVPYFYLSLSWYSNNSPCLYCRCNNYSLCFTNSILSLLLNNPLLLAKFYIHKCTWRRSFLYSEWTLWTMSV